MTMTLSPEERTVRYGSALYSSRNFGSPIEPKFKKTFSGSGPGVMTVEKLAVFRSGTFRDSMGYQNTWEKWHIDQMVSNFTMLRDRKLFENVPVRNGHPGFLIHGTEGTGKVIGWHTNLSSEAVTAPHDGNSYDFLFADFDILDPDAQRDYESGLLRSRSSEIGYYLTNSEAEFYPVYQGFAWVDIGAVEGLNFSQPVNSNGKLFMHGFNQATQDKQFIVYSEETLVSGTTQNGGTGTQPPTAPALTTGIQQPAQHAAPTAPAQPTVQFSINGQSTSDVTAVQNHISGLEQFRTETLEQARRDFVASLVASNKITAPQQPGLEAFALSLGIEQFNAWKETYTAAPVASLTAVHGGTANGLPPVQVDKVNDRITVLRGIVAGHRAAGTSEKALHEKNSYKELMQLTDNKG